MVTGYPNQRKRFCMYSSAYCLHFLLSLFEFTVFVNSVVLRLLRARVMEGRSWQWYSTGFRFPV
jgi:hypothetical protein